jgi:hypothetical protein
MQARISPYDPQNERTPSRSSSAATPSTSIPGAGGARQDQIRPAGDAERLVSTAVVREGA